MQVTVRNNSSQYFGKKNFKKIYTNLIMRVLREFKNYHKSQKEDFPVQK
jgi:hypothetical protein